MLQLLALAWVTFKNICFLFPEFTSNGVNRKLLNEKKFWHDLDQELKKGNTYWQCNYLFDFFTRIFREALEKYRLLKKNLVRGNHTML